MCGEIEVTYGEPPEFTLLMEDYLEEEEAEAFYVHVLIFLSIST
jgi:hypothetical protein